MAKKTDMAHRVNDYLPNVECPAGTRMINMSNALTRAAHGLNLAEKRIVMNAASKLDSRRVLKPGEVPITKISAEEYAETFGVSKDVAYVALKAAAKKLYERSITFYEPAWKRNGDPLEPTKVHMRWVGSVKYHDKEGWCELHWWPAVLPHLTGLGGHFTKYRLQQVSALRSGYSWNLLKLLMRFRSTGWADYTIEDFRVSMEIPESMSDFGQIRRRVIDPAMKELTGKDHWKIKLTTVKGAKKKIKALHFEFERDEQGQLFDDMEGIPE